MHLLDTSVLIPLRDGDSTVWERVNQLSGPIFVSIVSVVELEGGVYRDAAQAERRRAKLDLLLSSLNILAFDLESAQTYGQIVASAGYSRRKILDRMIAAQALNAKATLVTLNPQDFEEVTGLQVLGW
ncbi:MAG: VapC toxin family PIN domain ribonuclease [Alphaproteobacteria bacterium PA1]|nr:MAG: VapC toxin family PIN domain ribonuclease [Alphaproteobacteria bacterium PA1]